MFVIRQEHLDAFAESYKETFEDQMVQHLRVKFPAQCEELGEPKTRQRIGDGIERSRRYEIRSQADVARFIRFMFTLGPEFDTARKTRWVIPILEDSDASASDRLDRIRAEARERRQADRQKKAAKTESDVSSRKEWP